ncbi:MAG: hypothetical protein ACYCTE_16375 [Acidimicrobiales bacterium]
MTVVGCDAVACAGDRDLAPRLFEVASYDWIVVDTSAGKDSQAIIDQVVRIARAAGVADRMVAVHADLGRGSCGPRSCGLSSRLRTWPSSQRRHAS